MSPTEVNAWPWLVLFFTTMFSSLTHCFLSSTNVDLHHVLFSFFQQARIFTLTLLSKPLFLTPFTQMLKANQTCRHS